MTEQVHNQTRATPAADKEGGGGGNVDNYVWKDESPDYK